MAQGKTIVFVSHSPVAIETICRRVCVLDKGRLAFDGAVDAGLAFYKQLLAHPAAEREGFPSDTVQPTMPDARDADVNPAQDAESFLERFRLRRSTIAAVAGVVRAFVGREEVERDGDQAADLLEGARPGGAQERFQFGERELDRIEVRTVGRQESHERARPARSRSAPRAACGRRGCRGRRHRPGAASAPGPVRRRRETSDYRSAHRTPRARPDPRDEARQSRCGSPSDCRACDHGAACRAGCGRSAVTDRS